MTIQLQNLKSTFTLDSKGLVSGAKAALAGVGAVVAGMTVAIKATMDWAKDLDSLGDVMDGSNKKLAAIAFVARKSGVGVDALTRANTFLQKGLLKANGTLDTIGKSLKAYGINVKNANGSVKDSVQLTDEIAQKYKSLATQQERVNFLSDIYGSKTGPQLVDFFDTLNSDGGISAVTKKVEELGLAIDPARYEQFNRNLEELKLIGTGLAVQFTEGVMPALEGFLNLVTNKGIPTLTNLRDIFKEKGFKGVIEELLKGLDNIDFGEVSKKIINGINGIDWAKAGMDFSTLAKEIGSSIGEAVGEIDWLGIGNALASALNNAIAGAFGTNEAGMQQAIKDFGAKIKTQAQNEFSEDGKVSGTSLMKGLVDGFWQSNPMFLVSLQMLDRLIEGELNNIAKTFFNRGLGWTNQLIAGFKNGIPSLLSAIEDMVGEINAILRTIMTSFTLSVKTGTIGSTGGASKGGSSAGKNTVKPGSGGKRATGGAVVAGRDYSILELGRAEIFTPNQSGRVDPMKSVRVVAEIDYKKLARVIRDANLQAA